MAAKKRKAAKAAAPADPHADCPPPVWSGMNWECRNHGPEGVTVPRAREPFAAATSPAPAAMAPSPAPATQARQLVDLQAKLVAMEARVAALESSRA